MIQVTVLYPNDPGTSFDYDYWTGKHMPMVAERLSGVVREAEVSRGLADGSGGQAPYAAIARMLFDSVEDFQQVMGTHGKEILGDIPNYTNVQPTIQISEVLAL